MWERIRTAIILLIIVGIAMFATRSPILILPLLLLGVTIGAYEWAKIIPKDFVKSNPQNYPYVYSFSILLLTALALALPKSWTVFWIIASVIWLFVIAWVKNFPNKTAVWNNGKRLAMIGLILLTATMTAMYYLWQLSSWWLLYVFVLVWCADSGAYFVGRKFGKRKMSPAVSPNKSIEGLYGGLATGTLVVLGVVIYHSKQWSGLAMAFFLLLSMITIAMSVFGDLFESMLKRHAGIKDSGTFLPGHGGILDRIDSQLSAMPIFALGFYCLQYFNIISI